MTQSDDARPRHPRPGERLVTQFTPEQRGWAAAILVAFVGVAFGGPALTRMGHKRRRAQRQAMDQARAVRARAQRAGKTVRTNLRQLGGGRIWR